MISAFPYLVHEVGEGGAAWAAPDERSRIKMNWTGTSIIDIVIIDNAIFFSAVIVEHPHFHRIGNDIPAYLEFIIAGISPYFKIMT